MNSLDNFLEILVYPAKDSEAQKARVVEFLNQYMFAEILLIEGDDSVESIKTLVEEFHSSVSSKNSDFEKPVSSLLESLTRNSYFQGRFPAYSAKYEVEKLLNQKLFSAQAAKQLRSFSWEVLLKSSEISKSLKTEIDSFLAFLDGFIHEADEGYVGEVGSDDELVIQLKRIRAKLNVYLVQRAAP